MNSVPPHKVYLGLGSNLGDREQNLRNAISLIHKRVGTVVRQSSLIETEPWGFESDNRFINAAVLCLTHLAPREVLRATQKIERDLGKTQAHATERSQCSMLNAHCSTLNAQCSVFSIQCPVLKAQNTRLNAQCSAANVQGSTFKDRPIDIDILLYDDLTIDEPDLIIPHPLMHERDFVMIPLQEITDKSISRKPQTTSK